MRKESLVVNQARKTVWRKASNKKQAMYDYQGRMEFVEKFMQNRVENKRWWVGNSVYLKEKRSVIGTKKTSTVLGRHSQNMEKENSKTLSLKKKNSNDSFG